MSLAWTFNPQWCPDALAGPGCTHPACHRALALAEHASEASESPERYCPGCGEMFTGRECPDCESRHDRQLDDVPGSDWPDAEWWREQVSDTDEEPAF